MIKTAESLPQSSCIICCIVDSCTCSLLHTIWHAALIHGHLLHNATCIDVYGLYPVYYTAKNFELLQDWIIPDTEWHHIWLKYDNIVCYIYDQQWFGTEWYIIMYQIKHHSVSEEILIWYMYVSYVILQFEININNNYASNTKHIVTINSVCPIMRENQSIRDNHLLSFHGFSWRTLLYHATSRAFMNHRDWTLDAVTWGGKDSFAQFKERTVIFVEHGLSPSCLQWIEPLN